MRTREKILKAIEALDRPTVREIGEAVGIKSSSVFHHLESLRAEGKVTWEPGKSRTIKVVEPTR